MADQRTALETLNRSGLSEQYRSAAVEALQSDEQLRRANAEWATFFQTSHGNVFEQLDVESPRESLFVDTLYYDFVVERLIDAVEREHDIRVLNRAVSDNTDAISFRFGALHDRIVESASLDEESLRLGVNPRETGPGLLRKLYEQVLSRELRLQLGEYYTPRGVAGLAVRELEFDEVATETVLDPGCGSGVFLAAAIDTKHRELESELSPSAVVAVMLETVVGFDLNPVAVKSAKLSYLLALGELLDAAGVDRVELPVFLTDSLGLTRNDEVRFRGERVDPTVDHLVGNPPWVTWATLPESVRDAWRAEHASDLLPQSGMERKLGHANDDISLPFLWVCLDRYLADNGDASFVLKRETMNGPAGRLLRTQSVGERPVAVRHVHDFGALRPFDADVSAALYTMAADTEPRYPVDTVAWTRTDEEPDFSAVDQMHESLSRERTGFVPVDEASPSSSWVRADAEKRALGNCDHRVRHGVKDDAKDVFSIDRETLRGIEQDHVYPYIKSRHVVKYGLFGHDRHLVPLRKANQDNETELRETCPGTYEYLSSNRDRLESRSSSWLDEGPFYNLFGLGEYTWAPYKLVWCRLGFKPHFAVVSTVDDRDLGEKLVVPGDHFMFVPTDERHEAHFLCALCNSAPYQRSLREVASDGKSSLSKAVVSELALPEYDGTAGQRRLAELSIQAHRIVPEHTDVSKREYNATTIDKLAAVQAEIDELVGQLLSSAGFAASNE